MLEGNKICDIIKEFLSNGVLILATISYVYTHLRSIVLRFTYPSFDGRGIIAAHVKGLKLGIISDPKKT